MKTLESKIVTKQPEQKVEKASGITFSQKIGKFLCEVVACSDMSELNEGDSVLVPVEVGKEFTYQGEKYLLFNESDVIMYVEKTK